MTPSYSTKTSAPGRSPCGCSKSSLPAHSGCSCGCGGNNVCEGGEYLRPNFFSGQLLTEDDLQQLVRYILDKNRLHNKHFFGAGVVCGLEVTCDPCGSSMVTVHAGYALDCCGNDIVASCDVKVDINDLYRKLRATALGSDCGDPCGDPKAPPKNPPKKQEVCLYIRYCEEEADPVAPYSTGDTCGATQCEPTRIREGFRFELRCPAEPPKPDNLFSRIAACIGEPAKAEVVGRDSLSLDRMMKHVPVAIEEIRKGTPLTFTDTHMTTLATQTASLETMLTQPSQTWTPEIFQTAISRTLDVASLVTRYYATATATVLRGPIAGQDPGALVGNAPGAAAANIPLAGGSIDPRTALTSKPVEEAVKLLEQAIATLGPLVSTTVETKLDHVASQAVLDLTPKWATPKTSPQTVAASVEGQYFARGVAFTPALMDASRFSLVNNQTWLLTKVDCAKPSTDCTLIDELRSLEPSAPPSQTLREPIEYLPKTYYNYSVLAGSLVRYLRECACGSINPPCPPCDDMGVLLACLEMENCKVIRVCNLERTYVLTGVSARYWLPLSEYGNELEQICCPIPRRKMSVLDTRRPILSSASPVMRSIDALFGGGSVTTFAESVTTNPLDSLRLQNAMQAFRYKLAPAVGDDLGVTQTLQTAQSTDLEMKLNAVRDEAQLRLDDAMNQIKTLQRDIVNLKKKPKGAVNP